MSTEKLVQVQELIDSAMSSLKTAHALMRDLTGIVDTDRERIVSRAESFSGSGPVSGRVIEGAFDGQNMVDGSGQTYPVPANYASKSKLAEGDGMKLTITDEGKFVYKQIAPIQRRTTVGVLIQEDGQYKVLAEGKAYRVLLASVTFYRAEVGDQVTILLPKDGEAKWGAVEAVIPKQLAEAAAKEKFRKAAKDEDGELSPSVD
ncbi:TPA: hypothetical protein DCL30_00955 [Candidatus Peribacteria bacterium]|nr:MAG: hypothetical protein A3J91_02845 [Candidatus Peribacteria bacterium RIFOXYC2_FULL_58_10]OGJ85165.1 MAG: hypothetical protein A2529_01740 [Candidatus Peribacteria bacterium RIFOXYD2_FULL_58_15]HAI98098.1 hypothetical protein [Candidatus Peribacteria bacterium]HAS33861.1 hypothetical protein [Candidatus Peribacteria bacterium]